MKTLLILALCALPARADWGRAENAAAAVLTSARAEISVIGGAPLLDLLGARDNASQPLEIAGRKFLASVVFDADWNTWFTLKPVSGPGAGAWKEEALSTGVVYRYGGLELNISQAGDVVSVEGAGERFETGVPALFDLLYKNSMKVTFGGSVTYAVFRNIAPLEESEGTVSMRLGSDGLYYFSVTPDKLIESYPRWLVAVNGVLYGLRVDTGSLLFVSKRIDMFKADLAPERLLPR